VKDNVKITLLVPTLNEIEAVTVVIPKIRKDWADEFICIDGGSADGTVEFMRQQGFDVYTQTKRGFGSGMQEGMCLAKGEIVVEFMPDGNSVPDDIPRIVEKMNEGYDMVIGSRYCAGARSDDDDWLTGIGNWLFTTIVNVMFWTRYTDVLTGFRAYRRSRIIPLKLDTPGLSWPCQSCIRAARSGLRVVDIPANEPPRIGGQRKMGPLRTGIEISLLILREFLCYWPGARKRNQIQRIWAKRG
jgi:glycosyltransferase involved in cell wall biosynthesis